MLTHPTPATIRTEAGVDLRPGTLADAATLVRICEQAFATISARHGFPPDFPTPESAIGFLTMRLSHPGFYAIVAEINGTIVGSNFLDERSTLCSCRSAPARSSSGASRTGSASRS